MAFLSSKEKNRSHCTGLVLPGGGARGAYQVGVLKAIAEMSPQKKSPFEVVTGVSVGSINAAAVASHSTDFKSGMKRMEAMWRHLHAHDVYRTDFGAVLMNIGHWLSAILLGGLGNENPISIFDNTPLKKLLDQRIDYKAIEEAIKQEDLRALAVTASGLTSGHAITFFQGQESLVGWERTRRVGWHETIKTKHLIASSALPFVFRAQNVGNEYFCDGSLRLTAPLSPAIRLGAERILVIGARDMGPNPLPETPSQAELPSLGEIGGYMLDIVFSDNLDSDIERMTRINKTLEHLSAKKRKEYSLRKIELENIYPSRDMRDIAKKHARELPWTIRMLLRGLGAWGRDWRLPSYVLFEPGFIGELIDLGYSDAMEREDDLRDFLHFSDET